MKKLLVIIFSIFLVGGFFYLLQNFSGKTSIYQTAQAGDAYNVSGWAWSENIGWISFNDTSAGGGLVNYGVNINPLNGDFDGYAWSENIGWISFNPLGPYPASPNNSARLDINTNQITGWARALAYGDDGWDGWIKLNPSRDGVHLNEGTNELEGWAWGGDVVGWISFNCKDTNSCSKSDYKVVYNHSIDGKPRVKNLRIEPNYCTPGSIKFNWQFDDDDPEDEQSYYEIQIAKDNAFSDLFITASSSDSSNNHLVGYSPEFSYNTTYYARVKVKDLSGLSSDWQSAEFKTPEYAYPYPEFTVQPERPFTRETVNFIDYSICYISGSGNGSSCKEYKDSNPGRFTYEWIFNGGSPSHSNIIGDASTTYNRNGNHNVTLEITDNSRKVSCKTDGLVNIRFLPAWKEIP